MGVPLLLTILLASQLIVSAQQQDSGQQAPLQAPTPRPAPGTKKFVPPEPPLPKPIPEIEVLPPPPPIEGLAPYAGPNIPFVQSEYLLGRTRESFPPPQIPAVVRVLVGFVALLVMAYIAGLASIQKLDQRLNVPHLVTTGLPFFLLGFVASQPQIGILTPSVLHEIAPVMPLALGWIGFSIGARFKAGAIDRLPKGTGDVFAAILTIPLVVVFAACAVAILLIDPNGSRTWAFRDALLLATAGAMAARNTPHFFRVFSKESGVSERIVRVIELEQLAGVFLLLMVSAYYRPGGQLVNWQLPGTAWLFLTLGIGATMGLFVYFALTRINKDPQFTAVLLGSIAFTAGMSSFLRMSPLAVCTMAGVITANLGGPWKEQMSKNLERLERPVYFLFMVLAGALWHPSEWQGWVLMVVFIAARLGSKWFASQVARRAIAPDLTEDERRATAWSPMGALSVAIVVSAQDLYSGPTISWIVTAVIAGALLSEVGLQIAASRARVAAGAHALQAESSGVD